MTSNSSYRAATALLTAIGIFLIAIVIPKFLFSRTILSLAITQGLELFLSLLAIVIFGKSKFSEYGFCLPKKFEFSSGKKMRWLLISLTAPILGIMASIAILSLGGVGNPLVKELTLPQILLFVWIFSSIIEEIFTRGFLQGHLSVLSGKYVKLLFFRVELPVLISALFFASMHFVLLLAGIDITTMVVTFLFTL